MTPLPPDRSPDAVWKQRYRCRHLYGLEIARGDRRRAMVFHDGTGVYQAYGVDLVTGEQRQLTHASTGTVLATLAKDGRCAFVLLDTDGNEVGHWARVPFEGGETTDLTPSMQPYSSWVLGSSFDGSTISMGIAGDDGTTIWVCRSGAVEEPRRLLTMRGLVPELALTADGLTLVALSSERTGSNSYAVVALDVRSGESLRELWDGPPSSMGGVVPSPRAGDLRVATTSDIAGRARPLIWDIATGERTDLEFSATGDVEILDWSDDGTSLLLGVADRAEESLFRIDLETGASQELDLGGGSFGGAAAFGPEGAVVVVRRGATEPASLIVLQAGGVRVIIGDPDAPPARPWRSVSFPSSDGVDVQAWVSTPEGEGPYSTILFTHGGPESVTIETYSAELASWVDHGYAVCALNYRGSTTFGREYQQAIWGDLGHWESEDLAATAAWLCDEGIARPGGIVLTGGSYGGYLTLLGLGRLPDLWAGGIARVAVADWVRMYEESADTLRSYEEQIFGGPPDAKPEVYRAASPITYVEDLSAPLLVFQGSNDTRCPPGQFRAYESAARAAGKRIEVEWFEAGHIGPTVEQMIASQERSIAFAHGLFAKDSA